MLKMTLKFKGTIFILSFFCISHFLAASEGNKKRRIRITQKKKKQSKKPCTQEKLTPEQKRLICALESVSNELWYFIMQNCCSSNLKDYRLWNLSLVSKQFRNLILDSKQLKALLDRFCEVTRICHKRKSVQITEDNYCFEFKKSGHHEKDFLTRLKELKETEFPLKNIVFYWKDAVLSSNLSEPLFSFDQLIEIHTLYPQAFFEVHPFKYSLLHLLVKSYLEYSWKDEKKILEEIKEVCVQSPFYLNAVDKDGHTVLHLVNSQDGDLGIRSMFLEVLSKEIIRV